MFFHVFGDMEWIRKRIWCGNLFFGVASANRTKYLPPEEQHFFFRILGGEHKAIARKLTMYDLCL